MTREELLKIAKPILFNTDMTKAILEDRKTATRRICKDGNKCTVPDMSFFDAEKRTYAVHNYANAEHTEKLSIAERKCPICPGDILYVRETWCYHKNSKKPWYGYRADGDFRDVDLKWCPSIHMPKEAARIFLKVKDVRLERLQDITTEQILSEGIKVSQFDLPNTGIAVQFRRLWDSTIKKSDLARYGWDADPYVWVIEFERIKPDTEV